MSLSLTVPYTSARSAGSLFCTALNHVHCDSKLTGEALERQDYRKSDMDEMNRQNVDVALQGILAGEKSALGSLYDMYGKVVYSVSFRMLKDIADAEEVTQDVFLSLWKRVDSLTGKPEKVLPWLLRVVRNRSIDKIRKSDRRPPSSQVIETPESPLVEKDHADHETALDLLLAEERSERVKMAMNHLSSEQRAVIELAYFKGFTQNEIAIELQESLGTVKSRVRYALAHLRKELEGCHVV